jgi:shikimate dehydrogenase
MKDKEFHLGLLGWPLGHSLSPVILNAALADACLIGEYCLYPVRPLPDGSENLRKILQGMRSGDLHGLNVTIPHKQAVIPLLDGLTEAASAIGAVNVIFIQDGLLIGDNSDASAFREDLHQFLAGARGFQLETQLDTNNIERDEGIKIPTTALVIGAGGAARAVVYTLLADGWQVIVAARQLAAAQQLIRDFAGQEGEGHQQLLALSLDQKNLAGILNCHLIVNATPVGTVPDEDANPWPNKLPFPAGAAVYDLVYNPPETALIQAARAAGLAATSGLGMLVEQAALAFECWIGIPASRQAMFSAARRALGLD